MKAEAWIFMLASWAVITVMTVFCFYKLLTSKRKLGDE